MGAEERFRSLSISDHSPLVVGRNVSIKSVASPSDEFSPTPVQHIKRPWLATWLIGDRPLEDTEESQSKINDYEGPGEQHIHYLRYLSWEEVFLGSRRLFWNPLPIQKGFPDSWGKLFPPWKHYKVKRKCWPEAVAKTSIIDLEVLFLFVGVLRTRMDREIKMQEGEIRKEKQS